MDRKSANTNLKRIGMTIDSLLSVIAFDDLIVQEGDR
jgi:hypothetical protein